MNIENLLKYIETPEIQKLILNGYTGGYSIGIGLDSTQNLIIILHVQRNTLEVPSFPMELEFDNEIIPVIVQTNFIEPKSYLYK